MRGVSPDGGPWVAVEYWVERTSQEVARGLDEQGRRVSIFTTLMAVSTAAPIGGVAVAITSNAASGTLAVLTLGAGLTLVLAVGVVAMATVVDTDPRWLVSWKNGVEAARGSAVTDREIAAEVLAERLTCYARNEEQLGRAYGIAVVQVILSVVLLIVSLAVAARK